MADIHIITGDGKANWRVVMHFDVPNVQNTVGVDVSSALVNSGLAVSSVLREDDGNNGSIHPDEQAELLAGTKVEVTVSLVLDGKGTTNAIRAEDVRKAYAATETDVINKLKRRLKFFGLNLTRS